ncbi:hypothetical protein [Bacillus sp. FJAT-18017]|uniref:hypothetical protein n=1 Tax=Bacillus sp. FJAT-18017 TaxID=1705566 RepID=UPI000A92B1CA|nr:hypothetical protein [Bacillus sp. FJAT-18017]
MTLIHILNYTIPIAFMIFFGFWLDRLLKPKSVPLEASIAVESVEQMDHGLPAKNDV